MQIFYTTAIQESEAMLLNEEAKHCSRVLRYSVGDTIYLTDGKGCLYNGIVTELNKNDVQINQVEIFESSATASKLTIAIAPTKNISRFEWFLEKATEIGIGAIIPIITSRSERRVIKPERCKKILLSAMKQSKNFHLPVLNDMMKFDDFIKTINGTVQKFIAHCMAPENHLGTLYNVESSGIVLIGPEGDFTSEELKLARDNDWIEVSLGQTRLRTETAGIVATHVVAMQSHNINIK